MDDSNGPFIVEDLLRAAARGVQYLPTKVAALHAAKRVVFQKKAMRVVTANGGTLVMSPRDLLSFRGEEPYAVIHLH